MFNVLLDNGFPTEYKGYPLNTDFRVGIKLTLLQEEEDLPQELIILKSLQLLYKEGVPDLETAVAGLKWFLSLGRSEYVVIGEKGNESDEKCIDFVYDSLDIWGAFWAKGIDLTKVNMHWFKFMTALSYVGGCPLSNKISYRALSLDDLKGETRKHYASLKELYKVKKVIPRDEFSDFKRQYIAQYGRYEAYLNGIISDPDEEI